MDVSRVELNKIQLIANRVTIFKDISPYENYVEVPSEQFHKILMKAVQYSNAKNMSAI